MSAPAGGRWPVWGLAAAFYAYGFFQRVAPSVMVEDLMRDFALGGALLGSLSAVYFYAYAAVQIPVGVLLDRFGARRLLIVGTLLAAAGSALFALASGLALALVGRALVGAAVGFAFIATLKIVTLWFPPQRFGRMAGWTLAVGILGGIAGQAPLGALVERVGWRPTMLAGALLALALCLAIALGVRERRSGTTAPGPAGATPADGGRPSGLRAILRTGPIWLLTLYAAGMSAPILALAGLWLVPYLVQAHGLGRAEAGALASLMLAAWAAGGPAAGWLAERVGHAGAMLGGAAANAACLLALCLVAQPPLALILALAVVVGLAGGFMIVAYAHTREVYGSARSATAMGVVNSAVLLVGAALQSIIGLVLDAGWTGLERAGARLYPEPAYRAAFTSLALVAACALLAALALRRPTRETPRP
ncbi:MAG TPA: MFS transporter [Geminicoccaceae bacterium]|nr:MFS transporter [Geminicoccaceae bacterium]